MLAAFKHIAHVSVGFRCFYVVYFVAGKKLSRNYFRVDYISGRLIVHKPLGSTTRAEERSLKNDAAGL